MASALFLLLIVLTLFGYYNCSADVSSTLLPLVVLVLLTSVPFILSKIKQLYEDGRSMEVEVFEEIKDSQDHVDSHQENEYRDSTVANELFPQNVGVVPDVDDQSLPESAHWSTGSCEGSISDDDSLIEITLPGGHYVSSDEASGDHRQEFSPEVLFRKHGLMELLSEIYEEENLIEIDIAMGSIKCSRFEIKA